MEQGVAIQRGEWTDAGLGPASVVCGVISYGHFSTASLPFFRRRVKRELTAKGFGDMPFLIVSLEELDTVIRLVELGKQLDRIMVELATSDDSANVVFAYRQTLETTERTVSTYAYTRGKALLDHVRALPGEGNSSVTGQ